MRYGFIKTIIILITLGLGFYMLYPTYKWYYNTSQEDKDIASMPKEDLTKLVNGIEENIQFVRKSLNNKQWYKIYQDLKDPGTLFFNISPDAEKYTLDLEKYGKKIQDIVKKVNPSFTDFGNLELNYSEAKKGIEKLNHHYAMKELKKTIIKLGLDLAGGVHFVLGINEEQLRKDIEKLYQESFDIEKIKKQIKSEHSEYDEAKLEAEAKVKQAEVQKTIDARFELEKQEGIVRAREKITNRVDQFGVSEPVVVQGPQNTVVIELPGEKDKESAKEVITKVGRLSFHLVNEDFFRTVPLDKKDKFQHIADKEFVLELQRTKGQAGSLPAGTMILPVVESRTEKGMTYSKTVGYLPVFEKSELDGEKIIDAKVEFDQLGKMHISFELNSEGSDIFSTVTGNNVGKRLSIVLDGKIQSAPNIQGKIPGGKAQITGSFALDEAKTIASVLKSGSLPIPLKIEEERVIGPSLGYDQINKGKMSTLIAFIVVSIFMLIYYKVSGLNANFAQILNLFFIFAILAQFGYALTLPGIAGIVLTIGMSVDANILINERIKEELRAGRSLQSALMHGYQRAFTAIFDSNITTIMIGIVLAAIGTGPIKGFGVTLITGLITNMFTAVFVTHFVYDIFVHKVNVKKLSI